MEHKIKKKRHKHWKDKQIPERQTNNNKKEQMYIEMYDKCKKRAVTSTCLLRVWSFWLVKFQD